MNLETGEFFFPVFLLISIDQTLIKTQNHFYPERYEPSEFGMVLGKAEIQISMTFRIQNMQ